MASGLQDPLVLAHGVDHRAALPHGERERLFAINVLARRGGHAGHHAMPVVGHDDRHGVDVLARQQFAEIVVGVAALILGSAGLFGVKLVHLLLARFAAEEMAGIAISGAPLIHVANRKDLDVGLLQEGRQIDSALIARADDADVDPIAGSRLSEHRRRHQPGDAAQGSRGLDKTTSVKCITEEPGLFFKVMMDFLVGDKFVYY